MNSVNCSFTTPSDLNGLVEVSRDELLALVRKCPNICSVITALGNPDLIGIGVLLSYFMQFTLALIYGPYLFVALQVIPFLRKADLERASKFRSRFDLWLSHHQNVALWSQLLFTLTIVLACTVRRHEETLQAYEGSIISFVVSISVISAVMTWMAYMHRIERWGLFTVLVLTTGVLTIYAETSPARQQQRLWNVIEACITMVGLETWYQKRLAFLIPTTLVICVLILAWCYLQNVSNWGTQSLIQGTKDKVTRYLVWTAIVYIIIAMMYLIACTGLVFYQMLYLRLSIARSPLIATERLQENAWGIGQIIAPFAWAPLLVELAYAILYAILRKPLPRKIVSDADGQQMQHSGAREVS